MIPITFTVYGEARPAGSKRAFVNPRTGKAILTDASGAKGKDWRRAVADAAAEASRGELLDGPLEVTFRFYRVRPRSHYRTGRNSHLLRDSAPEFPTTRPDALKLARAAEDSMTGVLYRDDSQIVNEYLFKRYGETARLEVRVAVISDERQLQAVAA